MRDVRAVFSAGNGEVEIYEVTIPEEWNGHTIGELVSSEHLHTCFGDARRPGDAAFTQTWFWKPGMWSMSAPRWKALKRCASGWVYPE